MKKVLWIMFIMLAFLIVITGCKKEVKKTPDQAENEMKKLIGVEPEIVLTKDETKLEIEKEGKFAVKLEEDKSSGNTWEAEFDKGAFEDTGDKLVSDAEEEDKAMHYWGYETKKAGEYKIRYKLMTPASEAKKTIEFEITVTEQ